jgi:hypothetical protein
METVFVILGFLCALAGSVLVSFLALFALATGFRKAGASYLAIGVALLVIAYGLGIAPAFMLVLLVVFLGGFGAFFLLTLPATRLLPKEGRAALDGITTIEDVVQASRGSGLKGWDLVAYAQGLAANKFTYSRCNPWDSPARAFERGLGYCQQQALALHEIYRRLGVDSRPVYATGHCRFPQPEDPGSSLALAPDNRWLSAFFGAEPNVFGHTWLKVRVGREELDVCPGKPDNRPGVIHFEPLLEVKTLHLFLQPLAHLGAAMVNLILERQARRMGLREAY